MGIVRLTALLALLIVGLCFVRTSAGQKDAASGNGPQAGSTGQSAEPESAPDLFEPALNRGRAVIHLPTEADEVAPGGAGRYLIAHLKAIHSLAIVDLCNATVAHVIELPSGESHFAAGLWKLFVASDEKNSITRYDLQTAEKELTVMAPDGGVQAMAMGCASVAPVVIASGKKTFLCDPQTLRAQPMAWQRWGAPGSNWPAPSMRVSADGQTIIAWGGGWAGIELVAVDGLDVVDHHEGGSIHASAVPVRLNWSGSLVFSDRTSVFNRDLTDASIDLDGYAFGALSPDYVLSLRINRRAPKAADQKPALKIYLAGGHQLIATLKDLPELSASVLPPEQRIFYLPAVNLLAILGPGNNEFFLRRFSAMEALDESGIDYLMVTSVPYPVATRGWRYSYSVKTQSKRGGVSYGLTSGPPGMSIAADGTVRWDVPKDFKRRQAQVIVSIKDASGQEIFHTFTIHIYDIPPITPHPPAGLPAKRV